MKVLVAYQLLVVSAKETFCSDTTVRYRRLADATCADLDSFESRVEDAIQLNKRNECIVETIRSRVAAAKRKNGASRASESETLTRLEAEVGALKIAVSNLEDRMGDSSQAPPEVLTEHSRLTSIYAEKEHQLIICRHRMAQEALDDTLARVREKAEALGQGALLAAATYIGRGLPDSLSVWSYRTFQWRLRTESWLDSLRRPKRRATAAAKLVLASLDVASTALSLLVDGVADFSDLCVTSPEDVGALLEQGPNLDDVIGALSLQNEHLEALLAGSDL